MARVVDWHAGMLASGGAMERLRAAEKSAKERRLCLYANGPSVTSAAKGSNGAASNGQLRTFDATVIRIWSGDQITVLEKDNNNERRLQLSSTRGPKYRSSLPNVIWLYSRALTDSQIRDRRFLLRKLASS